MSEDTQVTLEKDPWGQELRHPANSRGSEPHQAFRSPQPSLQPHEQP